MSIIDLIVFIILFKYFRGMYVDVSEVERALYFIFAGWICKYKNTLVSNLSAFSSSQCT